MSATTLTNGCNSFLIDPIDRIHTWFKAPKC